MKKLSIVLVLSLAAFGCKKGGADCDKAITHSMELSKADMAGVDDKMMGKMKDLALQHCRDDKWSDEVVKCMAEAKTGTDSKSCYGKLTADQSQKMNKAAMELMTPPAAPAGSAAAPDTAAPK